MHKYIFESPNNNFTDFKLSKKQQHAVLIVPSAPVILMYRSVNFICSHYRIPSISCLPVNDVLDLLATDKATAVEQEGLGYVLGAAHPCSVWGDSHLRGIIIISILKRKQSLPVSPSKFNGIC